jgi:5-methylcytosine-specific restriction endonuclease McrA
MAKHLLDDGQGDAVAERDRRRAVPHDVHAMVRHARYRRNRDECMRRARWRCELRIGGVCIGAASECDHVVAVADGGINDVSNLRAACRPCHRARTAQQGGGFRQGGPRADPECLPRTAW